MVGGSRARKRDGEIERRRDREKREKCIYKVRHALCEENVWLSRL